MIILRHIGRDVQAEQLIDLQGWKEHFNCVRFLESAGIEQKCCPNDFAVEILVRIDLQNKGPCIAIRMMNPLGDG